MFSKNTFVRDTNFSSKSLLFPSSTKYFSTETEKETEKEVEAGSQEEKELVNIEKEEKSIVKEGENVEEEGEEEDEEVEVVVKKTIISSQILSAMIGCKHYKINNEINLDPHTIVRAYTESDILIGDKPLKDALDYAKDIQKDLVLRNEKTNPPIVKVMRYKLELMKRLLKKLSKNKDFQLSDTKTEKIIGISLNIEENDLQYKIDKSRDLMKHVSHIKLIIPCDLLQESQKKKAEKILEYVAGTIDDVAKISKGPYEKFSKKGSNRAMKKSSVLDDESQIINQEEEEEMKDIIAYNKGEIIDSEDLGQDYVDRNDCLILELESLLVDISGIDYEMMMNSIHVEDIFEGLKNNTFLASNKGKSTGKDKTQDFINNIKSGKAAEQEKNMNTFEENIDYLESLLDAETDMAKKLYTKKRIREMRQELKHKKEVIYWKTFLKTEYLLQREKYKQDPGSFF
eukprot:CAMPEP_0170529528 /NCGR_PEP_ID=MMETSP0209-20121228/24527_1 /TAXON_ID=665100 ORGANISM="Litonotus pictus, Strain P1" /NCGR_SAMPLE_ID=MMETSP0209 /ASSEMBLY_ACC=CAM_ASM_000301 /LENGTH=456 /DNA_ID=CAMNT_0010821593 /DNA_START=94 /DNA_END=1464 /DNA_ORIENTATION=+